MYRRGDPRWNRTIQNIADNIEHANESTQEHLYSFTHSYVNPCLSSITQCLNSCTEPCLPARDERRRHHRRSRGRAELSFDFYDDWEEDENDGLLGWGGDSLDRMLAGSNSYGAVSQPGRQRAMSYGTRNRDPRYNAGRRKSAVQPHDGGPDPTIIPSSSYFGFLGRLPFKIGGKGLRYKPSAADLTEHPGQTRRSLEEEQPLIEDSDEDAGSGPEHKGHRRQRSHTNTSGHTTDSLSSRGDIFPSEDELDDAVPLDDEFTAALERRTTSQWQDESSSGKAHSIRGGKRPSHSQLSSRRASSRNSRGSRRKSNDDTNKLLSSSPTPEEAPTLSDLKQEEERIRLQEEGEIERRRHEAQKLAVQRGLATNSDQHLSVRSASPSSMKMRRSPSPSYRLTQSIQRERSRSPLVAPPATDTHNPADLAPFPQFEEPQTAPDSGSFHIDDSDYSSFAPTPNRPLSLINEPREIPADSNFVPARLPHFDS
ncbi:hypothetical protein BU24DRAFT_421991 [Aaosphaeria arxii CBS 175.79]|uniref:Uncharacterized protein n=1 Tax=Aaosphaeria arxii CBS 175.79 TaxID=1450172 RepID=A0A6A5XS07_9PLEO|nr:uncharacterized protein BU24DRAFT_421991 [Aaosphaeria arxii CBS 175.79]KAF2015686.1 hypothetical protein BU24DRAFT_421991 [Aaosphaeria arxii CBS 175.79]